MKKKIYAALAIAAVLAVAPVGGKMVVSMAAASGNDTVASGNDTVEEENKTDELINVTQNPTAENVESIVATLEQQDNEDVKKAYENAEFLQNIAAVEDIYKEKAQIRVEDPMVSQEVKDALGAAAAMAKVYGAVLNAESDTTVALSMDVVKEGNQVAVDAAYTNAVQVDIKLLQARDGEVSELSALKVPVLIQMAVPQGMNADRLVILHYADNQGEPEVIQPISTSPLQFAVSHFSTFVFAEKAEDTTEEPGGDCGSDDSSEGGNGGYMEAIDSRIASAAAGSVVEVISDSDSGITLSNADMQELVKRGDVTLVLRYQYKGTSFVVTIPAGAAEDNDIAWYGPLYLAAKYGNGTAVVAKPAGDAYVVKSGDTMGAIARANGISLAQLAAKNPQIKDINRIRVGQLVNLK